MILKVHSFESTCFLRSIWKNLFFLCLKSMTKCFNPIIKCCLKRPSLNLTITKDYKHLWIKAFLKEFNAFKIENRMPSENFANTSACHFQTWYWCRYELNRTGFFSHFNIPIKIKFGSILLFSVRHASIAWYNHVFWIKLTTVE